jgi:ankyrin repeat protein
VHAKDREGSTALQYATFNGSLHAIKLLVELGHADPLSMDKEGSTPLHKGTAIALAALALFL